MGLPSAHGWQADWHCTDPTRALEVMTSVAKTDKQSFEFESPLKSPCRYA